MRAELVALLSPPPALKSSARLRLDREMFLPFDSSLVDGPSGERAKFNKLESLFEFVTERKAFSSSIKHLDIIKWSDIDQTPGPSNLLVNR